MVEASAEGVGEDRWWAMEIKPTDGRDGSMVSSTKAGTNKTRGAWACDATNAASLRTGRHRYRRHERSERHP